jgi:hypothetical protein
LGSTQNACVMLFLMALSQTGVDLAVFHGLQGSRMWRGRDPVPTSSGILGVFIQAALVNTRWSIGLSLPGVNTPNFPGDPACQHVGCLRSLCWAVGQSLSAWHTQSTMPYMLFCRTDLCACLGPHVSHVLLYRLYCCTVVRFITVGSSWSAVVPFALRRLPAAAVSYQGRVERWAVSPCFNSFSKMLLPQFADMHHGCLLHIWSRERRCIWCLDTWSAIERGLRVGVELGQ